jgi:hypothetical protein
VCTVRRTGAVVGLLGASLVAAVQPPLVGAAAERPVPRQVGPPPSWVVPGMRVSYYVAAASVAQSSFAWIEDPDGDWEDPVTGKRYRRTDETGESIGGASGDGYSIFDVLATDAASVTGTNTIFAINRAATPPDLVFAGSTGTTVGGSVVDGLWIHPDVLAGYRTQRLDGMLVLVGPYALGGVTYDAVAFASTNAAAYSSYTYDSATGLLLVATTRTAGATSPISAVGEDPPTGNTQLTYTQLLGVRQRTVPGLGGANPVWVASTPRLDYAGMQSIFNPLDTSLGSLDAALTMAVQFGAPQGSWIPFTATTSVASLGMVSTQTGVAGPPGPYWIDPAALAAMVPGQVIDRDPVTTGTVTVTAADPASVTIADVVPGFEVTSRFDRATGVLSAFEIRNPSGGRIVRATLQTSIG